jgi:general nucleoside transport system permease protein
MAVDTAVAPLVPVGAGWWERRARSLGAALLAVLIALLVGAAILLWAGASPVAAYRDMVRGAIGSRFAISQLLVVLVPLLIIGLGLAVAFRGRIWNIGAEGQFHLGALAGGALAIVFPFAAPLLVIPVALLIGAAAGAAWGWIAGELRSRWGVNEIITSLLLNYVAIYWYGYFIRKPLRDPSGFLPQSREIPTAAQLPNLPGFQIHVGLIIAVGLVAILAYVMARTPFGFRVTAMGLNPDAAAGAAGVDTRRSIVRLMLISGGLAGLAGIVQILGVQLRLQVGISPGFGFTAIIVALLGRMRPVGVLLAALLIAGLSVGGQAMQFTQGVPIAAVHTIQALFVLFLLVADKLVRR